MFTSNYEYNTVIGSLFYVVVKVLWRNKYALHFVEKPRFVLISCTKEAKIQSFSSIFDSSGSEAQKNSFPIVWVSFKQNKGQGKKNWLNLIIITEIVIMVTSKLSKTGSKSETNLLSNKYVQHKNGLKSCLIAPVTDNKCTLNPLFQVLKN